MATPLMCGYKTFEPNIQSGNMILGGPPPFLDVRFGLAHCIRNLKEINKVVDTIVSW